MRPAAVHLARACAAHDDDLAAALWHQASSGDTLDFAGAHGVLGELAATANRLGVDGVLADRARRAARDIALRQLSLLASHRAMTDALRRAGIPSLTLKGPVLQSREWGVIVRDYHDLDVLVRPAALADALEALEAAGGAVVDRNWPLLLADGASEVHCSAPGGVPLDLHWHPVNHRTVRRRFSIDAEDLFARAVTVELPTGPARALDASDALLHVALHAALSGGHRLLWLVDVARSSATTGVDWNVVAERAVAARVGLPVACMLARATATVGAAVPSGLSTALVTRAERSLVASLHRWTPSGSLPGGGSIGRVVARSLRDGLPATARAAAGAGMLMVHRIVERHEYWLDDEDPRNVRCERGGSHARAAFLECVARGDAPSGADAARASRK